ncbi:MAG: response regulator [Archangiaceae bacterium]|nr:response regulator [Archangiaceae bacterium]
MATREERRAALIQKFKEIAAERVARMVQFWLELEQHPDHEETSAELLRELHTLKGEAKTVGFADIAMVSHLLESLLFRAKDLGWKVPRSTSDVVLKTTDALSELLRRTLDGPQVDLEQVVRNIDGELQKNGVTPEVRPAAAAPAPAAPPVMTAPAPKAPEKLGHEQSLRVRADRIAGISEVAGELLVEQGKVALSVRRAIDRLGALEPFLKEGHPAASLRAELTGLDDAIYQLGLDVSELDRTVRELRLVPVSTLLMPYARMVRDLGAGQDKDTVLQVQGGEVEADKRVLEVLDEPVLHLLRNCVDHGIESPAAREAAGKPRQGTITIGVRYVGGALGLTVSDDGAGIDPAALKTKAVERGLITRAVADDLSEQEARELVFLPNFSTRDEATQLSGRGVGMDVVKRRVEQLGGQVKLSSVKGQGITVEMVVPISISLTRALIVEVGEHLLAIPSVAIESIRQVDPAELFEAHEGKMMRVDGQALPVAHLDELITGTRGTRTPLALVVRHGARRWVLLHDALGREASLVVRPLGAPLQSHRLVTGVAVLDSGRIALVLDVGLLVSRRWGFGDDKAHRKERRLRVLCVDDSFIMLSSVTAMVKDLGFQVLGASDGQEALTALHTFPADLVVTDMQMPRLDGLGLIRALRSEARWAQLPVIVLSSLGSSEDKRRAAEAGATAYLVKADLTSDHIADAIERLLGNP